MFAWRRLSQEMYVPFSAALVGKDVLMRRAVARCPGIHEVFSKEAAVSGLAARWRDEVPADIFRRWLSEWGGGFLPVMLFGAGWWCAAREDRGLALAAAWAAAFPGPDRECVWDGWGFRAGMPALRDGLADEVAALAGPSGPARWVGLGRALWFLSPGDQERRCAPFRGVPEQRHAAVVAGVGFAAVMTMLESLTEWEGARAQQGSLRWAFDQGSARARDIRLAAQPAWTRACLEKGGPAGADLAALPSVAGGHAGYLAALA